MQATNLLGVIAVIVFIGALFLASRGEDLATENVALKAELAQKSAELEHAGFIGFQPAVEAPPMEYAEDVYGQGEIAYLIGYPGMLDTKAWSPFNGVIDIVTREGKPCLRVRLAMVKGEYQVSTRTWRGKVK